VPKLQDILKLKGFNVVGPDFLEYAPGEVYDAVVMNPPFEGGQDMIHIRHAYDCLKDGGSLLAVASKGVQFRKDNKYVAFREWLDEVGGWIEDLPEKSFAPATDVAAVYIHLVK
jgi:methylase of polypeptide subunit release factors